MNLTPDSWIAPLSTLMDQLTTLLYTSSNFFELIRSPLSCQIKQQQWYHMNACDQSLTNKWPFMSWVSFLLPEHLEQPGYKTFTSYLNKCSLRRTQLRPNLVRARKVLCLIYLRRTNKYTVIANYIQSNLLISVPTD